jgi:phosphatidylserine decarboxylase
MAELVFEDSNKNRIKVVHRVKQSFAPLYLDVIELQNLRQTSRYGMMINGVTTLYFPSNFRVNVNVGNELKASESLMGYFS